MSDAISRFFRTDDPNPSQFFFDLPDTWWSRPCEYAWAGQFAAPEDVALDAACGICHPFKFHLLDKCQQVHACDLDARILDQGAILAEISEVFGEDSALKLDRKYLDAIEYKRASLTSLPYQKATFDKIYCLSVLEHLNDAENSPPYGGFFRRLLNQIAPPREILAALKEFHRVMKSGGVLVLTFDYPRINLDYLRRAAQLSGFCFVGEADFQMPANPLYSSENDLCCFRALLRALPPVEGAKESK